MTKSIVAIIGRQNTGKSTLLNRIAGKPLAIVQDQPGTTRDRIFASVSWQGTEFTIIDTGGLEPETDSAITRGINAQIEAAIDLTDVIIFLTDVTHGITPTDRDIADRLRRIKKPVLLVINKADNTRLESEALEFYELGLGDPLPVAAHHGRGIAELLDRIISLLPAPTPSERAPEAVKVAIVGRPNVGKSMLLNALVGDKRAIVDATPGTTRDAIDTMFDFNGQNVLLIDTAGVRRRGSIKAGIERYSVIRTLRAIDRCDITLLLLDATEPATSQDLHIGGYIQQAVKGMIIIVNKWDLITKKNIKEWNNHIKRLFKFLAHAPVLFTSAKTGQGVNKIMPQVMQVYQERLKRLTTATVNGVVQKAVASHNRPHRQGKQLKVYYATQAEVNPPTFVFFANDARLIHFTYKRYLENKLRQAFGFDGTPIRLVFKTRGEP
jgi:GTP-binding protein